MEGEGARPMRAYASRGRGRGGGGGPSKPPYNRSGGRGGGGAPGKKQPFVKPRAIPDYILEKKRCAQFLEQFNDSDDYLDGPKYVQQLKQIIDRKAKAIVIEIDDIVKFAESVADSTEQEEWLKFSKHIQKNTMRYIDMFSEMIDELLENISPSADVPDYDLDDVIDVLRMYREARLNAQANGSAMDIDGEDPATTVSPLPKALTRRYELYIAPPKLSKPLPLRKVRAQHIGGLVKVMGIVTRITEVKPLALVVTYTCSQCSYEVYQEVNSRSFTPLASCPSVECRARNVPGRLYQQTRGSKFIKFQEMRLQEMAEEVPMGHIPYSVTVHVRGETTRQCNPGDVAEVSGIFLPAKTTGFEAIAGGLIANTFIHTMQIVKQKKSYAEYSITPMLERSIHDLAKSNNAYTFLAKSLAPEIYGHDDIKKALLLLMVGGATLTLPDGMKIRGDINICLMGDPGVAKSQLLKHISHISPRGVYTSGKGSSGVGLTAAVVKDTTTNEFVLEGGALVLADMGVCCIDEFDKMEDADRTAIHEVMEQQTISIAKAGITTTLNARTAILAAANPAYGRYNTRKTPEENINLPAALLSRFDLLFLILDKPDRNSDMELARHICYVHKHRKHPPIGYAEYATEEFMRAYIALARNFTPTIPEELSSFIVDAYVNMRADEVQLREQAHSYTTARTLQAILRMSQALARIRLSAVVTQEDVEEAMRLMYRSKSSLEDNEVRSGQDPVSVIYGIIRDCSAQNESPVVREDEVLAKILAKGFTQSQLEDCLREYEELNVWCFNPDTRNITFSNS